MDVGIPKKITRTREKSKMFSRGNHRPPRSYNIPLTKQKNIFCVQCKHPFFIRDLPYLHGTQIPVLLHCGHPMCSGCTKTNPEQRCPICKTGRINNIDLCQLSLNIYALGLLVVAQNIPMRMDEPDIAFQQSVGTKLRLKSSPGNCKECGIRAILRCMQCAVLYCNTCSSKIHGRALQSHTKVMLTDICEESSIKQPTTCSEICDESICYYCKECNVSCCSHCMLRLHPKHDYITQLDKNNELLPDFCVAYNRAAETLYRINQTEKKLYTTKKFYRPDWKVNEEFEATINQHFTYLHGVLQNIEKKMIEKLYQHRNRVGQNLNEIEAQLKMQKQQLYDVLSIALSARNTFENTNVQKIMRRLEELADSPCHLVQNAAANDEKIQFDVDDNIVTALEEHCAVRLPSTTNFSLVQEAFLPEDYEMEPLSQDFTIPLLVDNSRTLTKSPSTMSNSSTNEGASFELQNQSVTSVKPSPDSQNPTEGVFVEGSYEMVVVTHVIDPFCFYVQSAAVERQVVILEKQIAAYAATCTSVPTEIQQGKLYIVQNSEGKWFRGTVAISAEVSVDQIEICNVFNIDTGTVVKDVPISNFRNISKQWVRLAPMAMKCTLHNIVPRDGKWQSEATKDFWKLVDAKVGIFMNVIAITGDTYYVDLIRHNPKETEKLASVRDSLVFMKHGNYVSWNNLKRTNPRSVAKYFTDHLQKNAFVKVAIQVVESPDCIYVTKVDKNAEYHQSIMTDLAQDYEKNAANNRLIYVPGKEMPCVARGIDGLWSRAIISDVLNDEEVKIFFVDSGYSLVVTNDKLRKLHHKYLACHTKTIRVSLKDVKPFPKDNGKWNTKTLEFVKEYLKDQDAVEIIALDKIEDTYSVYLYIEGNVNFNKLLTNSNLAESPKSSYASTSTVKTKHKQIHKNKALQKMNKEQRVANANTSKDDNDPFKILVTIHQVKSPECIYVGEVERENVWSRTMQADMQIFYDKYKCPHRNDWEKGTVCAVYSPKDKTYLRANILNITSEEEVQVVLYDVGIEDTVIMKHIQPLHKKFARSPTNIFKIKLAGILPCGGTATWPVYSCEKLLEIINDNQNCKFYITKVVDGEDDGIIPVELWVRQSKMEGPLAPTKIELNSINRMLVEMGVALPIKNYAAKKDKVLAIDLRQQLKENRDIKTGPKLNVKWFSTNDNNREIHNTSLSKLVLEISSTESEGESTESLSDTSEDIIPLPPKLSAWIQPSAITDDEFIGIPTYLDHSGALYLHSKKQNKKTLKYIETTLAEFCENVKIKAYDKQWTEGDICIVQYHCNKKWYRGVVQKILENNLIQVKFVDYGNIEECEIGTLKKKVILGHIPIQCTKCVIHGLIPNTADGNWRTEDLDKIHALLVDKECAVFVLQRTSEHVVVAIKLLHPTQCELISYLINELKIDISSEAQISCEFAKNNHNTSTDTADVVVEEYINTSRLDISEICTSADNRASEAETIITSSTSMIKDSDIENNCPISEIDSLGIDGLISSTPQNESCENILSGYKKLKIPSDIEVLRIRLLVPISSTQFYAQLEGNEDFETLEMYTAQYNQLMDELQSTADKQPFITCFESNTPCCAQYLDDKKWYRSLITASKNINSENIQVTLQYVDFGNYEYRIINIHHPELYTLKENWLIPPIMGIKVNLFNIEMDTTISNRHGETAMKVTDLLGTVAVAKVKHRHEDSLDVELYADRKCTQLLYAPLIDDGLLYVNTMTEEE